MTFTQEDIENSKFNLWQESAKLFNWFKDNKFDACADQKIGLELESCLINKKAEAVAKNQEFLDKHQNPLFVPELSGHNIEFNARPQQLTKNCFSKLDQHITQNLNAAQNTANNLDF